MTDAEVLPLVSAGRDRRRPFVDARHPALRPIRIVIADGQPLVRAGLRALLEADDDVSVVGQAADADEATALALQTQPDVLLIDSELPRVDDVELAQLTGAVRAVARGEAALAPSVARRLTAQPDIRRHIPELTTRERELVALVAGGLNNCGVALALALLPTITRRHGGRG